MKTRTKRRINRIISPMVISGLKVHNAITKQERARMITVNEKGEILLVRGFVGKGWTLPGGGIEKGESPIAAALRELYEETGVSVAPEMVKEIASIKKSQASIGYTVHIFMTMIQKASLPAEQFNKKEIIELEWFSKTKLPPDLSTVAHVGLELMSKQLDI